MARYAVNEEAVAYVRDLIDKHQYVLRSEWGDVQPDAEAQNAYLERHDWSAYGRWHLGLTDGASEETKGALRVRGRRLPPGPSQRPDRLRLPGGGVAAQGRGAGRPRPAAAPGRHLGLSGPPRCVRRGDDISLVQRVLDG